MKKIIETAKKYFAEYQKELKYNKAKKDFQQTINGMMKLSLDDKMPAEAIRTIKKFKLEFDKELAKRSLEMSIEVSDIDEYFKANEFHNQFIK